jgi:hypothetical protein
MQSLVLSPAASVADCFVYYPYLYLYLYLLQQAHVIYHTCFHNAKIAIIFPNREKLQEKKTIKLLSKAKCQPLAT